MQAAAERRLTIALCVIAVVAVLFFPRTARDLQVPIALAVLVSHALEPVVRWLERHRVPRIVEIAGSDAKGRQLTSRVNDDIENQIQ